MGMNADWLWNHCDGEFGRDETTDTQFLHNQRDAEHVFCFNLPFFPKGAGKIGRWERFLHKMRGTYRTHKAKVAFEMLRTPRDRTSMLLYEPPPIARRFYTAAGETCSRVWAPDENVPPHIEPTTLPAFWMLQEDLRALRAQQPRSASIPLAAIISGKTALPGHEERLGFLRLLRQANVPLELFGMNLPPEAQGRGAINSKGQVLRAARCTLAIENYAEGSHYITEKFWDPLLSWSVPLYYGSRAVDQLVPPECFIRIPSLDAAGVEVVKQAVSDPGVRERRLEAMAEARRRCLEELRVPLWLHRQLAKKP